MAAKSYFKANHTFFVFFLRENAGISASPARAGGILYRGYYIGFFDGLQGVPLVFPDGPGTNRSQAA
jgi:hypothetical protein